MQRRDAVRSEHVMRNGALMSSERPHAGAYISHSQAQPDWTQEDPIGGFCRILLRIPRDNETSTHPIFGTPLISGGSLEEMRLTKLTTVVHEPELDMPFLHEADMVSHVLVEAMAYFGIGMGAHEVSSKILGSKIKKGKDVSKAKRNRCFKFDSVTSNAAPEICVWVVNTDSSIVLPLGRRQ